MESLLHEDAELTRKRIERFQKEETEKFNQMDLKKAQKLQLEEGKWQKEVINRLDVVPEDPNYYEKLAIKPGFDFYYALINSGDAL